MSSLHISENMAHHSYCSFLNCVCNPLFKICNCVLDDEDTQTLNILTTDYSYLLLHMWPHVFRATVEGWALCQDVQACYPLKSTKGVSWYYMFD